MPVSSFVTAWAPRFDPIAYRPPRLMVAKGLSALGDATPDPTPEQKVQDMRLTTTAVRISGDSDTLVRKKVQLLRDMVVAPALAPGPLGMAFTQGILTEALGRAPKDLNSHNKSAIAVSLFEFVRSRIRYVNDPLGEEYFQTVPGIWKSQMGDCEDFMALLAALFTAAGIKVRARVIKIPSATGWAHIYPQAFLDKAWRSFDATMKYPAGWQYPDRTDTLDLQAAPELSA
jgi:hypothetical protein